MIMIFMVNKTVYFLRWKLTNRIECFTALTNIYKKYSVDMIGISIYALYKKNLRSGWSNDYIEIVKLKINP